jgi:hypothetical protein
MTNYMRILFNRFKIFMTAIILISGLLFYNSCTKDSGPFTVVPVTFISFNDSIQPILTASCAKIGCHVAGAQAPDLSPGSAYYSLINGEFINKITPDSSIVYKCLVGSSTKIQQMPPGGPYNPSNIESLMLTWIQQGAPNN